MKRNITETALGAVVLLVAASFLAYGYQMGDVATPDGYDITADFSAIGGLQPGDEVQISGVKVGSVTGVTLVKDSYLARVHMSIDSAYQLPTDTSAAISSESLLGGKYLQLQPGADDEIIPDGGEVNYTQAPQNLEELLGQFIFSVQNDDKSKDKSDDRPDDKLDDMSDE